MNTKTAIFHPEQIEFDWEQSDDQGRSRLLNAARDLPPALAILPVILGLPSRVASIRSTARDGLVRILNDVGSRMDHPEQKERDAASKEASLITSRLYRLITPNSNPDDKKYYFTALTAFGAHGAFFAFKLLLRNILAPDIFLYMVKALPESQRLEVVDEYLRANPCVRLEYARIFKAILKSISSRETVIYYYAGLFDRRCSADPFLNHIDPVLRDPETLMANEIESESLDRIVVGLKAMSMLMEEVPPWMLKALLRDQNAKQIRMAVYTILEHGATGGYPSLYKPVWQNLCRSCADDPEEAVAAFRALVVCSSQPAYRLMDSIKADCPNIPSGIFKEISELSRIAFIFIQDMAVNRERYAAAHPQISRALILGLIRKRPERILKVLKKTEKGSHGSTAFVETINNLLLKEAESVNARFDLKGAFSSRIRYSKLREDEKNSLLALADGRGQAKGPLNLQNRVIEKLDLRDGQFAAAKIYFNHSVVKGGDWSGAHMSGARFNGCILYGVDLSNARFKNVCFDNALLRNVRARGAVFHNCSFRGAKIINSNFSHADLSDALFTGAAVSRTEFKEADLSFASFAHGELSGQSFVRASLDHADFSSARAMFVRLPGDTGSTLRTEGTDFNARQYLLTGDGLPDFSPLALAEINLMLFCEFTRYGRTKFQIQNRQSLLAAFDVFKPGRTELFQIVPMLLHRNIELRGSNPIDPATPCGICDFTPPRQGVAVLEKYSKAPVRGTGMDAAPVIEALYTMGSIGSLAQTPESDIDYWVCIDGDRIPKEGLALLEQKLRMLEILAGDLFDTSVTFFIVDVQKVRRNDFGGTSQESSGSAQARLLKEEFYRTMIHIAGKIPLWAVVPTGISLNFYNLIFKRVSGNTNSRRYIDLGDVHSVPVNEYFGASLWQMFKWLKSPFKSVIKLALFEIYAKSFGKEPLLCNRYKDEWMNAGIQLRFARNDSYIAILDKLLAHYRTSDDKASMDIILTCFFLKLEVQDKEELEATPFGIRKVLLERMLGKWGWYEKRVLELGRYRSWSYEEVRSLSADIEDFMFARYDQVKQVFKDHSRKGHLISDKDRERLTRKVDVVYKEKFYKIKKLFLIAENDDYFSNLSMKYLSGGEKTGKWEVFQQNEKGGRVLESPLFRADRVEHICAWLLYNRLYNNGTPLGLVPNPTSIGYTDLQNLYKAMKRFFSLDFNPSSVFFDFTESLPTIVSVFVTINLEADRPLSVVEDYCVVYVNSWGEMFCRPSAQGTIFDNLGMAKKDILAALDTQTFPVNTEFYFPRGKVS
ncbi:MAG: class I adenylate cyclase [Desulfobacter sp.]|nr:MAG: class I adenylate cyclase [Desulfobacter sp.]